MTTIIAYIDGYNLYHGIMRKKWWKYLWLDIEGLMTEFMNPNEILLEVKYYTSPVRDDRPKEARQKAYWRALRTSKNVSIIKGRFAKRRRFCYTCGSGWNTYEEKKTDTNLACDIVEDAFNNRSDAVLIISGDGDMVPPITTLKRVNSGVNLRLVLPPSTRNKDIQKLTKNVSNIEERHLRAHQFPPIITQQTGSQIICPVEWTSNYTPPIRTQHILPIWVRKHTAKALRFSLRMVDAGDPKLR